MEYYQVYFNTNDSVEVIIYLDDVRDGKSIKYLIEKSIEPNKTIKSIKKLPSCEGCRYEYLGQRDHMNIGGCLYSFNFQ